MFKRTGGRVGSPAISIVPDGRIALNAASARAFSNAGAKAVFMFWDSSTSKMAMKAAAKGDKNSYAVSLAANLNSGSIRAKSFMEHVGWKAEKREMLPAEWNEKEQMLEIALPAQIRTASAKAKAK